MKKAQIKSTGKIVEVTSRFMPKKRNAPSREWMCNLSDGTCINERELEYIKDSLQNELDKEASEYADKHYSEWEEHWDDYNGYNTEPENDKLQLIDAYKAGAEWASSRWISVNEKLPPEDEEVIVLTNEANGYTLPIARHLCFAHIVSDKTMFVDYDGWNIPQVRYWIPCPELPEK